MRYALISDIHANAHALRAVIDAAERDRVNGYLCAGDIIGYGALPNECVDLLRGLPANVVAGNHELIALDRLPDAACTPTARAAIAWTRGELSARSRAYLETLPTRLQVGHVVVTHGSLNDPTEYVRGEEAARRQLDQLAVEHPGSVVLVLGHTHHPMVVQGGAGTVLGHAPATVKLRHACTYVINPGSVGQPRDGVPHARYAVLDLAERRVELRSLAYDIEAALDALRQRGLPPAWCFPQRPRHRIGLRTALRRLTRPSAG